MLTRTKANPTSRPATAKGTQYVLDEQIGFLLRVAMQRHTAIFMSQIPSKLTQTQFAALAKLLEVGACSQNQLGRLIYLDAATIKGVVDRLKLRKFVITQADPGDRRRRAITLTEQGRAVTKQAIEIASRITASTLIPLSAEEQRNIVRLLKKLT
jgi:DNA-binding MarR family transcriptional regulator